MKRILNLILLVFTLVHGYGQENVHRYIGADGSVIKIKDGIFVYLTPAIRGEGGGYDTLAVCSLRRVNEHFVELNSRTDSRLSGNKISVVQSSTASGNRESVGFRLKVPYKRGALSVELFEEESLIPIYRLTYANADTVFTLPPEVRNKKLGLFIVPEKYFHVEQDGRFFGRLFYVSDCLREFVIEDETDEVTVEIPGINDLFFDTYQVENEYAQVTDDAIVWKGKTWKRASLIP